MLLLKKEEGKQTFLKDRRDDRRDKPDARVVAGALILNRKVEMFQKKLRHLYLVEATAVKV